MPGSGGQNITQVVFIDSRAPDIQELIAGAAPGQLVFVLDPSTDGVQQIASILESNHLTGLAAISIVGHGASGQIQLGSSWLDESDLAGHAAALSAIGASLTDDGDLLLYACNTAAGTAGQQFIANLAAYTGADVAAATHLVGSADGGGSWTLDASTGAIEAQTPFNAAALANFQGELAINGQLFIATNGNGATNHDPGNGALIAADNRVMAVNNDGSGATTIFHDTLVGTTTTPIQAQRDLVLDPASGLYFTLAQDPSLTGNNRVAVLVGKFDGSAPTIFYQNPDTGVQADLASISIDAATHTLYVSQIADYNSGIQTNNGIFSFTYDPVTGALSNKQQVVSLFPLTPGAETGSLAGHVVNGLLYFTEVTYTATDGDFRLYSYNVATHAVTALTPSGTFTLHYTTTPPIITTGQSLGNLAVNSTTNKIYFLQNTAGGGPQHLFEVSASGGTPVEITVPGGLNGSISDLAIDSANNTLYLSNGNTQQIQVFSIGADGTTLTAAGTIPLGLQPPPGAGNPDNDFGIGDSPYDRPAGIDFVDLPALALTGTSTHAVQQGAALTLLTGAPNITDPTGGYLTGATVTISNFQAGDLLAASVAGTSITANYVNGVLTLSGLDTIAHYKTVMASIAFTDGGNSGVTTRSFDWKVNSGEVNNPSGINFATTSVNVDVNHAPVANADVNAAFVGATVSGNVVVANDTDADNDTLTVTGFVGSNGAGTLGSSYNGQYGHLTLGANGAYSYIADNAAAIAAAVAGSHPVETITYTITDGHGGTASTTLKITIDRAPVAAADTAAVVALGSASGNVITASDTDKDGDALTVSAFSIGGSSGTVGGTVFHGTYGDFTLLANGSYTYTAGATPGQQTALANAPGGHPTEVVNYTVSDGLGGTASTTLTITLDRTPVAVVDTNSANSGSTVSDNVLLNDTDKDNDTLTVTSFLDGGIGGTLGTLFHGSYGDITLNADGSYTYTAGAIAGQQTALNLNGGHGTEVVTYNITDGNGGTSTSTLTIDVSTAPFISSVTASTVGGITDLKAGKVVTITVNFNDPVFVAGGTPTLQLSNNEVATFVSGSATTALVFTYTVQPGDDTPDLLVQSLLTNGGTIKDGTGQDAILTNAATDLHLHIDTIAPTVTVTADHTALTLVQGTALVTFAFSEAVSLFTINDVIVTGGSFGALTHVGVVGGQDIYTAVFTPDPGNAVTASIQVPAGSYSDGNAANAGTASNVLTITADTVAPTVSVTADHNLLHAGDSAVVTFTFSEAVAGFGLANIVANGGTVDNLVHRAPDSSGHDIYTVVFTPNAVNAEVGTVGVGAGSFTDAAGNAGTAGAPVNFSGDTLAPTVAVTATPSTLQAGQTSIITFSFSEAVTDFTLADVIVNGGTLGTLTHVGVIGIQDIYTAIFTPDVSNALPGSVRVDRSSYTDTAGNVGAGSTDVSIIGDTRAPIVSVAANPLHLGAGQISTVTFTFSEIVSGFTLGDVVAVGGTMNNLVHVGFANNQDVYTADFTPNAGNNVAASVSVLASSYTDAAGNAGAASNTVNIVGDTLAPTVAVTANRTTLLAGQTALLTFTFSEAVTDFALGDITVSGGALNNLVHVGLVGGQDVYTAVFTPLVTNTEVGSVQVNNASYTDVAGNTGAASNAVNFTGDTLRPTVSVAADRSALLAGQVATLTFSFSDANPAFALSDVFVQGGSLGNLVHVGPVGGQDVYTATFTPASSNATTGIVYVNGHAYADAGGNPSPASNLLYFNVDTLAPTLTITANHTNLHPGDTAQVTFTFSETAAGFTLGDVTLSGGALSNLVHYGHDAAGHDIYTATFTPGVTDNLAGTISVAAASYTDVAGNSGAASNALHFTGDTKAPATPTLALQNDAGVSSTDHITNNAAISYSATAGGDRLYYNVDSSGFSTTVPNVTADGKHTVSILAIDAAGNASGVSSLTFTLDTTAPHVAGLTASPGSGTVSTGSTVQLTLSFDEAVKVNGGTPTLTLNDGSSAVYNPAESDSYKLVFDHLVSATDQTNALAVTGYAANGASVSDIAGNAADLSHVTALFEALHINETTAPPYTIGNITRPELHFDSGGHILLDDAASAFVNQYGMQYLYLGLPPGTPYPPVADLHV